MKLATYIEKLRRVERGEYLERVKSDVADFGLAEIAKEFPRESDPYGARWAPIQRNGQILYKTGALSRSFSARPTARGVRFSSSSPYAVYQQGKRNMLPTDKYGLPLPWLDAINRSFRRRVRETLAGG